MEARRLETVVQFCVDPEASRDWYPRFLGIESTPYDGPHFHFGEHAYLILASAAAGTGRGGSGVWFEVENVEEAYRERLAQGFTFNEEPFDIPPGRLVTALDPDGNIVGLINNSTGGMPDLSYE
jgi:catechol 2,3-dioxygenase-like lactoylglutathione lyase family enzyme